MDSQRHCCGASSRRCCFGGASGSVVPTSAPENRIDGDRLVGGSCRMLSNSDPSCARGISSADRVSDNDPKTCRAEVVNGRSGVLGVRRGTFPFLCPFLCL